MLLARAALAEERGRGRSCAHQRGASTAKEERPGRRGLTDDDEPDEDGMQYAAADDELDGGRCRRPPASGSSAKVEREVPTFHSREERPPSTSAAPAPSPPTSGHGGEIQVQKKIQRVFLGGRKEEEEGKKKGVAERMGREGKEVGFGTFL